MTDTSAHAAQATPPLAGSTLSVNKLARPLVEKESGEVIKAIAESLSESMAES